MTARRQSGDSTGRLWLEPGVPASGAVAEVAPVIPVSRTYTYCVPESLAAGVAVGQRVTVRVGRSGRLVQGFVVALDRREWDSTLRPIASVVDQRSFLSPELVALARDIAHHYHCPLGRTLKAITPEAVRQGRGFRKVRYLRLAPEAPGEPRPRRSAARRKVMDYFASVPDWSRADDLSARTGASAALLKKLIAEGRLELDVREESHRPSLPDVPMAEPVFELNAEQREALACIHAALAERAFRAVLLYGVSGSGKTEVYIHAIRDVLAAGRQAILMVPEIVLTTQLVNRLAARLPRIALMHSGLAEAQRSVLWRQIAAGERDVVVGTRSAIFAPCPNLGLIVVDEEQEPSFKNLQLPRFHVRDVAIMRALRQSIPVILGSATPSLETWYKSQTRPDFRRAVLPRRVRDLPMPQVVIVDMEIEHLETKKPLLFSRAMEDALSGCLARRQQALLLINRRGFANRIYCPACRARLTCPNCNVNLVVHTAGGFTTCHYCRMRVPIPQTCPNVNCGEKLVQFGIGTQRIERILSERFPSAKVRRVDSDTMRRRADYEQVVADFEARKIDVLVGTQMIAKGLDFPFVSFVGVFDGDAGGLASDFRAHERLFQLITQVAGRAGRADAPGRVVVQTAGGHDVLALRYALRHDFESFAEEELAVRQRVGWPPFRRLARIVLSHGREQTAREHAETLYGAVDAALGRLSAPTTAPPIADILGPSPCTLSRIRGKYRYELIIRARGAADLTRLLDELEAAGSLRARGASLMLDVDPVSMA